MQKGTNKVIVIGAGVGGLATSIRLARKGYQVEVFESNSYPGGKLTEIRLGNYRFDAGPSLLTLPELIEELFHLCGVNPEDRFPYNRLDITCKYFYADGTQLTAFADRDKLAAEVESKLGVSPDKLDKALKASDQIYKYLGELFMFKPLRSLRTWLSSAAIRAYTRLPAFQLNKTMHQANQELAGNQKLTQLFNRYATYNGSNPYQAPGTLNLIRHLEFSRGAFFPGNGMHQITGSLYDLAVEQGVKFHFETPVTKVMHKKKRVLGVVAAGESHFAASVITNSDMTFTYSKLLPDIKPPRLLLNQEKSSSALIFYWGIKEVFPQLDLHNIFFSHDYQQEFTDIFVKKTIGDDPTIYVNITSKFNPEDAPKGSENWFVMINVPNNSGQDWDQLIKKSRKVILEKLSNHLGAPVEPLIEEEDYLDPRRIQSRTSSWQGALYGNSSNSKYAAFLRHANKSARLKNLYFCGGSVHPGGGIPLALSSARIVDSYFKPVPQAR